MVKGEGYIKKKKETSKKLLEMPSIVSNESLSTMCDENRTRFGMPLVFTNILSDILNVPNEAVHHRESITSLVELLEESRRVIRVKLHLKIEDNRLHSNGHVRHTDPKSIF
jgi:hypothetical protein